MYFEPVFIFSFAITLFWIAYKIFGKNFMLSYPDNRKKHNFPKSQIGGLIFGPLFLLLCYFINLAPYWYIIGGIVCILLGFTDDIRSIHWIIKLIVQLSLAIYLVHIFDGEFEKINFYNFSIFLQEPYLNIIFIFWFVGILNAVNLIDGVDGLAGGYIILLSISMAIFGSVAFNYLHLILLLILLAFSLFNQRQSKIFMGDAGSLFLGYHTATLPLLYYDMQPGLQLLNVTPFILIASYLIADTSRVVLTRLAQKKHPMGADTIHFHHLMLQTSGSYLSSVGFIYLINLLAVIGVVYGVENLFSTNFMIIHLSLILIFILTPPLQTYVPIITKTVGPFYNWQKTPNLDPPLIYRTLFIFMLLVILVLSIFINNVNLSEIINLQNSLALLLISIFVFLNYKTEIAMYAILLGAVIFFGTITWTSQLNIITKIITVFLFISFIIFTLEKRKGCYLKEYSALDVLMIILMIGCLPFTVISAPFSPWTIFLLYSIWFGLSFVLRRTM